MAKCHVLALEFLRAVPLATAEAVALRSVLGILAAGALYGAVVASKFGALRLRGARLLRRALAGRRERRVSPGSARITFVCPVTRPAILARFLDRFLAELDEPVERLFYPNVGENARVAARLFNTLAARVETEFVAFCHQDWGPIDRDWVARTLAVFDEHPACRMVAQIGVRMSKDALGGQILDRYACNGVPGSFQLHAPDEQCFVVPTAQVRELPFDEASLPEFHFYAVDYAYELQRRGFEIWSTPALAYHDSPAGALTSASFKRARRILRGKYGPGVVRATTGWI